MLDINPLPYRLFANTFSHSQGGLPFFFFFFFFLKPLFYDLLSHMHTEECMEHKCLSR